MPPVTNPFASPRDDRVAATSDGRTPQSRFLRQLVQTVFGIHLAAMAAVIGAVLLDLLDSSWAMVFLFVSALIAVMISEVDRRTIWGHNLRVQLLGDAQSYLDRSILHWSRGRPDPTLRDIERAIELDSNYGPARQFHAQTTLAFNPHTKERSVAESVIANCDWLIEHQHEPAMAHAYRGASHLILEDHEAAVHDASIAISGQPTLSYALAVRAYGNAGRHDYEACLKDTSVVIEQGDNDVGVDSTHAQALHHCGRTEESIAFAKSRVLRGNLKAEWSCWLGVVYSEVGDYKNADASLQASIALNPSLVDAWLHLTNLGFHKGDLPAAKLALQRAIELDISEQLILQCQSILAHQERRFDDAIDLNSQLLEISEEDAFRSVAFTNRAYAWHALKNYQRASDDYEQALNCQTLTSTRWRHVAWFLSTCPEASYRDGPRAIELMRRERERRQDAGAVCLAIDAAAHAESGKFDRAIELQKIYQTRMLEDQKTGSVSNLDVMIPSTAMEFYEKRQPLHCDLLLSNSVLP